MGFLLTLLWSSIIAAAVLFAAGFGLTRLLAFERIRGEELLIMPFAGLSLMVSVGYWAGRVGWSAGGALVIALTLSTLLTLLALFRRKGTRLGIRGHLFPFALACVVFAIAVYPIGRSGRLGPIGLNGDQVLYTNVTAYLEKNGLPAPPPSPSKPATVQLSFINWGFPLGFNYVHAFVDKLSGREAHETFSVVTALSLALTVPAYAFLARSLFGLGSKGTFIVTLLTSASPMLIGVHYDDYGMHAIGLGLVPLAFGSGVLALEEGSPRSLLLPALLLSAALTSYPFATIPFAVFPLAIYALLLLPLKGQRLRISLRRLSGLGVLAVLLNVPGVLHVGKFLLRMVPFIRTKEFGNIEEYVPWAEVYGLSHHLLPEPSIPVAFLPGLINLFALTALLLTLYGVWRAGKPGRLCFLSLALAYIPFILWFRFVLNYPYGFFKALTFLTFAAIIGLASGVERLFETGLGQKAAPALPWAFVVFLLTANLSTLFALARQVAVPDLSPFLALRHIKNLVPEGETIHVRDERNTFLLWITYFLKGQNLSLAHYSPYFLWEDLPFYQKVISTGFVLVNRDSPLGESWAEGTIYENSRYRLLRKDPRIRVHLDFEEEGRLLKRGRALKIRVFPDRVFVDGESFPLGGSRKGRSGSLRLGVFIPKGSAVRISSSEGWEAIRLAKDLFILDRPIVELPMEIILTPQDARGVLVSGWLELVVAGKGRGSLPQEEIFERFRQEVLPGSGFFAVSGWHALETWGRWTRDTAVSVFRNPLEPISLRIRGFFPDGQGGKARFVLNGRLMGEVEGPGDFSRTYLVGQDLLGSSHWGELEVSVNRTFNPKALKRSSDPRDLGVAITELMLVALEGSRAGARGCREGC